MKEQGIQFGEKELFTAIRAIVIANSKDSEWFILSEGHAGEKIASIARSSFKGDGITVTFCSHEICIKLRIKARPGLTDLISKAKIFQEIIYQDIYHLTGVKTGRIDVTITGVDFR
ncbi:hypothetical protein [Mesobacillus foraminis]|uniref:Uncharacterized protein n=1 Tax=Mesobacillus foraminis TaxID=279826 RepID=A0A4R2BH88_9BACI|nr:hypothetical protein [Mesobacillus foraminis]TCN25742.1 hypothetical protein EV146_105405 [Mesobacillus foraminis]